MAPRRTRAEAARRAALLAYCRIDELSPDEEPVFEAAVQAAVSYMEEAGIAEPDPGTPRRGKYDLCFFALVLDAWDRRGTAGAEKSAADNPSFRRMVNQLKLTAPVSKLDTGTTLIPMWGPPPSAGQ